MIFDSHRLRRSNTYVCRDINPDIDRDAHGDPFKLGAQNVAFVKITKVLKQMGVTLGEVKSNHWYDNEEFRQRFWETARQTQAEPLAYGGTFYGYGEKQRDGFGREYFNILVSKNMTPFIGRIYKS